MNYEQLVKGQKAWENIAQLQKNIEILENGYCNSIIGWDYSHGKDGERVAFDLNGELREMVTDYLRKQLKDLKAKFEQL
jgi:hypothetical protein